MVSTTFPRFLGFLSGCLCIYIAYALGSTGGGWGGRLVHDRPIRRIGSKQSASSVPDLSTVNSIKSSRSASISSDDLLIVCSTVDLCPLRL